MASRKKTPAKKQVEPRSRETAVTATRPKAPWEQEGTKKRFVDHRVAFSGRFEQLRKADAIAMLEAEGASVDAKLGKDTTLFVYAVAGSANHQRAQKMQRERPQLLVLSEDEFRRLGVLPTLSQAREMLGKAKDRKRLARLLELNRTEFSHSTDEYSTIIVESASFRGENLSGASLTGLKFIDCDLRETNLAQTQRIFEAVGCDFRNAKAPNGHFGECENCDFRDAAMDDANLDDLENCRFDQAGLRKASLNGLASCRFDGAQLDRVSIAYGDLSSCSLIGASFQKATLEGSELQDCDFSGADFRSAKLMESMQFERCSFRSADFRNATLTQVCFVECDLTGADFEGATIAEVEFTDTDPSTAKGLELPTNSQPRVRAELAAATPTFKNIQVEAILRVGRKKMELQLYQFDHGGNPSRHQAWLSGDSIGSLTIDDAIFTIARLHPKAELDESTFKVKSTKGSSPPSLKPKQLKLAILAAWSEAFSG
ncbi:MAG: pentapeptide repeat-containing protein [Myxococcota bacterium]